MNRCAINIHPPRQAHSRHTPPAFRRYTCERRHRSPLHDPNTSASLTHRIDAALTETLSTEPSKVRTAVQQNIVPSHRPVRVESACACIVTVTCSDTAADAHKSPAVRQFFRHVITMTYEFPTVKATEELLATPLPSSHRYCLQSQISTSDANSQPTSETARIVQLVNVISDTDTSSK